MSSATQVNESSCQIGCIPPMAEGLAATGRLSPIRTAKLTLKRRLRPETKRTIKRRIASIAQLTHRTEPAQQAAKPSTAAPALDLQPGELVHVRSLDEIRATLDVWGGLRGCGFLPEMAQYCGTTQRVLKPVRRAVDERDYRVKKFRGLVLLEGVICQGTADFGRCDRACFYFWREEWLERAGSPASGATP